MKTGEIVVARVKGEATVGRYTGPAKTRGRVRVALGRNREVEVPADRVIMDTGVVVSQQDEAEAFRQESEALASEIDLAEVWEIAHDEASSMNLTDLAGLYWGPSQDPVRRASLLLHLARGSPYFTGGDESFTCRSRQAVEEACARYRSEEQQARATDVLAQHLSQGRLPDPADEYQARLLEHLRGYVIHGDDYTRRASARRLLERADAGTADLQRAGFELLVRVGILSPDEPIDLEREGIVRDFPPEALTEASSVDISSPIAEPERRDLTSIDTFTVDDADTEDRDDAITLAPCAGSAGEPTYRIGIHIADAGALVPIDGAVDREADRRMASLYIPDGKVPMLPSPLPDHTGSLVPDETRPALSLLATIAESGEVVSHEIVPSVIRSDAALSYEEADRALDDPGHRWNAVLAPLNRVAQALALRRREAGAVGLERAEMLIRVREAGTVDVKVVQRTTPARRLVTEYMILFNSLLADLCAREGIPAAYRSQAAPDLGDTLEYVPEGPLRQYLLMRRLPPADLGTSPAAHAGLGVAAYVQATSPLRRYPDLVMQRQVSRFLASRQVSYSTEAIASVAQRADVQLREIGRIEEGRRRYWFLKYLEQEYLGPDRRGDGGAMLQAVALDNRPGRLALLELVDYPFRIRTELAGAVEQGDTVALHLHSVDLWRREANFVHDTSS